jgi:hypothetical protein
VDPLAGEASHRLVVFWIVRDILFGYKSLHAISSVRAAVQKRRHIKSGKRCLVLLFGALEFIDRSGVKRASTSNAAERQLNDLFG